MSCKRCLVRVKVEKLISSVPHEHNALGYRETKGQPDDNYDANSGEGINVVVESRYNMHFLR